MFKIGSAYIYDMPTFVTVLEYMSTKAVNARYSQDKSMNACQAGMFVFVLTSHFEQIFVAD